MNRVWCAFRVTVSTILVILLVPVGLPMYAQRTATPAKVVTAKPALAALPAVQAAFKVVLAQPAVRAAVRADILRQLRETRPVAFASGVWATPIDLGQVYAVPSVRAALVSNLGPNGVTLVNGASVDPGRIGLLFVPDRLGRIAMGTMAKDIVASIAAEALQKTMTGVVGLDDAIVILGLVGLVGGAAGLFAGWWWQERSEHHPNPAPFDPKAYDGNADPDGDGQPNYQDDDDDGDGYAEGVDNFPDDPNKHICDCSGRGGIFFGRGITDGMVKAVFSALDTARARSSVAVNLGAVQPGQTASLRVVLP